MCCNSEVLFVLSNVNLVVYPDPTEAVANTLEGLYQEANKIDIVWNWIGVWTRDQRADFANLRWEDFTWRGETRGLNKKKNKIFYFNTAQSAQQPDPLHIYEH